MIPRALAIETMALLKPDSCQAMADASEDGAPLAAAIDPICWAVIRPGAPLAAPCVGTFAAAVAAGVAAVVAGTLAAGAPAGTFSRVPAMTKALGARPLAAASD